MSFDLAVKRFTVVAVFIAVLLTVLSVVDIFSGLTTMMDRIDPVVLAVIRWIAILGLSYWVWQRKSLTTWILFSMVIGAEFGYDFPAIASELKVVSKIFLKLIKTIIAPLIFGTLVVGIAGHANLKQVGRMGWKSILYFEVATTIALFIGLLAINISKAGEGITLPPDAAQEKLEVPPPSGWQDIILHI